RKQQRLCASQQLCDLFLALVSQQTDLAVGYRPGGDLVHLLLSPAGPAHNQKRRPVANGCRQTQIGVDRQLKILAGLQRTYAEVVAAHFQLQGGQTMLQFFFIPRAEAIGYPERGYLQLFRRQAVMPDGFVRDEAGVDHDPAGSLRSEEHTSELQSRENLVCRLLLEKKKETATT